jgi:hypothetical protein
VHGASDGAEVPIAEPADIAVVGHGSEQIALDVAGATRAVKEFLPLLGRGLPVVGRIDAGRHQASITPSLSFRVVGCRGTLSKLPAPPLDPSVVVLAGPPATVLGLVLCGTADGLLRLAHLGSLDEFLQEVSTSAEALLLIC